jgi:von Willebrand factor type A domain
VGAGMRRLATLAAVLTVVVQVSPLVPANANASDQATLQEVFAALKVDQLTADYVVVVDTSKSMRQGGLYGRVRDALVPFLRSLSPKDHMSLLTFDTVPTVRYSGAVGEPAERPLASLPSNANGEGTDIGAAIETGLGELERPGAQPIGTLLLLTDGKHDPPPGSPYPTSSGSGWADLSRRGAAVAARHAINAYALGLRSSDTDAALLKRVFPQTVIVALPSDQIGPYFGRSKDQVRLAKARALLTADTTSDAGVKVIWRGPFDQLNLNQRTATAEITLTSAMKHLPLELSDLRVTAGGDVPIKVDGLPRSLTLQPGEARRLPVTLHLPPVRSFGFGSRPINRVGSLTLGTKIHSSWRRVMQDSLGLTAAPRLHDATTALAGTGTIGWPWSRFAWIIAAALAALALLALALRQRKESLVGAIEIAHDGQVVLQRNLGGKKQRFGRGPLKVPGLALAGSIEGVRRRDPFGGGVETGVRLTVRRNNQRRKSTLYAGDSMSVGDVDITYIR